LFAALVYNHQIHFLTQATGGPPAAKVIAEMKNMESRNGRVDHSARTSSDLVVCVARAVKLLARPDMLITKSLDNRAAKLGKVIHFRR
jgi:hypothetical protein